MRRSTERILVSHAGVLPRPDGLQRLFDAGPEEQEAFDAALPGAVADVVARQVAAGIDIVNDGEISKHGLFIGYIRDRMSGFEERTVPAGEFRPRNAGVTGRDSRDFPGFYAAGLGGFPIRRLVIPGQGPAPVTEYVCTGPLKYTGATDARADIDRLSAAAAAHGVDAFLPAITPGTVEHWLLNEHYPDDESFLAAIADVLHEEYKAITDAGLLLQVDDPDLPDGWQMFPDMTVPEYRRYAALRVEALNHALRGIPPEQVRLHVCWGSHHGPHRDDIPLRDIVDLILSVPAGCYSIEAANPRHEHEWIVWEDAKLPDGATLMPGVVGHATDIIEHPELIAQRLTRYAQLVGAENVIAGTDCGLAGRVGHAEIVWAKLEDLAAGARLASRTLADALSRVGRTSTRPRTRFECAGSSSPAAPTPQRLPSTTSSAHRCARAEPENAFGPGTGDCTLAAVRVVVTGSSGHLGEALVRVLRDGGHEVTGVDLKPSPSTTVVGSVADRAVVRGCLTGADAVLHTATLHKPHVGSHSKQDFVDANVTGTLTLLEEAAAAGVRGFVFTSSTSAFGRALTPAPGEPAAWITEEVTPRPRNIYGVTKTAAEDLCELAHAEHGLPVIVLRTSRFFPEGDDSDEVRTAYADANVKANEYLYRRVDVADVVDAHLLAMERAADVGFGKYIVSATTPFTRGDLAALRTDAPAVVRRLFPGYEAEYARRGWRMFPSIGRVYVNTRARADLGWTPRHDFRSVLDALTADEDPRSPLARAVGLKGYHDKPTGVYTS